MGKPPKTWVPIGPSADHYGLDFTLVADEDMGMSRLYETVGILGVNRRDT